MSNSQGQGQDQEYLRLSTAIILGDSLRVRNGALFLAKSPFDENQICGCAIGGAILVAGYGEAYITASMNDPNKDARQIRISVWPWLELEVPAQIPDNISSRDQLQVAHFTFEKAISNLFHRVCKGKMTIEQLADLVRAWEEVYDPRVREQVESVPAAESLALSVSEFSLV